MKKTGQTASQIVVAVAAAFANIQIEALILSQGSILAEVFFHQPSHTDWWSFRGRFTFTTATTLYMPARFRITGEADRAEPRNSSFICLRIWSGHNA